MHRDETFQTGILTLTGDEHSARRNKNLRIVLDNTNTKSTWRARERLSRALYHVGIANTLTGLCSPVGTGCAWDTMSGDISATCGASSISSLDVLILVCTHHAHV